MRILKIAVAALAGAVVLTAGMASGLLAAGSSSSSSRPAPARTQPSDYDLAVKAIQAKDYAGALSRLQQVVRAEPRHADAWNWMGFSYRNLKQFDQALTAYQKALALDPKHRGAHEYLGELYLMMGDRAKAGQTLETLRALCPSGCKEYDDLQRAFQAHETARKTG